jgi:hypothetical protein
MDQTPCPYWTRSFPAQCWLRHTGWSIVWVLTKKIITKWHAWFPEGSFLHHWLRTTFFPKYAFWFVINYICMIVTRGRCYDHNFLRFLPIFGEKMAFFSKTNGMIKILHNLALSWVKNANFLQLFLAKYFKNHNIGPRSTLPIWTRWSRTTRRACPDASWTWVSQRTAFIFSNCFKLPGCLFYHHAPLHTNNFIQ